MKTCSTVLGGRLSWLAPPSWGLRPWLMIISASSLSLSTGPTPDNRSGNYAKFVLIWSFGGVYWLRWGRTGRTLCTGVVRVCVLSSDTTHYVVFIGCCTAGISCLSGYKGERKAK